MEGKIEPTVIVHGGAAMPEEFRKEALAGVKEAAISGYKVLKNGGSALDAAEAGVVSMEDNPLFNAGTGSVLTYDGLVEMDAIVMEGDTMKAGAVGAVKNLRNPVKLARLVMERTPHVLLVGEGANKFAEAHDIHQVDTDELVTDRAKKKLDNFKVFNKAVYAQYKNITSKDCETVGCCAVDINGKVAGATSTGGITGKMPGRVGDTPCVGGGVYADDQIGAVSTTGHGEAIMRACLAIQVTSRMGGGATPEEALKKGLAHMESRIKSLGGAIAVSCTGQAAAFSSTPQMPWAFVKGGELHYGMCVGEHLVEPYVSS